VSIEKPIKQDDPLHFAAAKGAVAVWRACRAGFDCLRHRGEIRFEAGYKRRNHGAPLRSAGYLAGLGQVLAALALILQIAVPSLHRPILLNFANSAGDLNGAYDEHALCLARGSGDPSPEAPADQAPKPTHHDLAACCFWHGATGFALTPTATIEPVTFAKSAVHFNPPLGDARTLFPVTVRARAPPVRV
jgi:hypothetical protein